MLNQLTNYLLQYRRVSIPSVGTIQLVQQPPQLNVVDKVILPPSFRAELLADETVTDHQVAFLAASLGKEKETVMQALHQTGTWLQPKIERDGFDWKGIGLVQKKGTAAVLSLPALEPVPAERVLRQGAEHNVLVGDQHLTSTQIASLKEKEDGLEATERKTSPLIIAAWTILVLAILYVIFVLYQGKFKIGATGLRMAPTGYWQPPPAPAGNTPLTRLL